jgi:hypothetical protein
MMRLEQKMRHNAKWNSHCVDPGLSGKDNRAPLVRLLDFCFNASNKIFFFLTTNGYTT